MKGGTNRFGWIGMVAWIFAGCYSGLEQGSGSAAADDAGGSDTDAGSEEGDGGAGGGAEGGGPGGGSGPPPDCQPGALGCECLDGSCGGLATCLDGICQPAPPTPEVDDPGAAIAGMAIPLEGNVDDNDGLTSYEELHWEQVEGPSAVVDYEYSEEARAYLPAGAAADSQLVFQLSARLGEVTSSAQYPVTILPTTPSGPMDEAVDVVALGASLVARAGNDRFWLATDVGSVSRIADGAVEFTEDLGSRVAAILPYDDGVTLFSQPELGLISSYNQNNNTFSTFISQLSGGGALGPVSAMVVDDDENVYIGTEDGNILLYDSPDNAEPAVTVLLYTVGEAPTALALGQFPVSPDLEEDDEGIVLYFGTAGGDVKQIVVTEPEVIGGPPLDTPELYIDVPGSGAVTGLTVDDFGNMWVAKGGTLHLVRRAYDSAPSIVREIDPPTGLGGFAGLASNGGEELVWIDPSSGRVATLRTFQN